MPVGSHELRPRGALAIFDSALHVCSQKAGVWALTLPSSAFVVASLLTLAEAVRNDGSVGLPALMLAVSWVFRGISQGAASHHVEQCLLETNAPSSISSLYLAFRRAPLFIIVTSVVGILNILAGLFTLGVAFLFFGPLMCSYALCMSGNTPPLSIPRTCHTQLGPTSAVARGIFWLFSVELLVMLQLWVAGAFLIHQSEALFSLDLSFLSQFLLHRSFILTFCATFVLFEPMRACVATLLLIDARVRKEGLDLLAQVARLPKRVTRLPSSRLILILVSFTWFASSRAEAAQNSIERVQALVQPCVEDSNETNNLLEYLQAYSGQNKASFLEFVSYLERLAQEEEGCERVLSALESAELLMFEEASVSVSETEDARARAKEILSRPQFSQLEKRPTETKGAFNFWKWLLELLEGIESPEVEAPPTSSNLKALQLTKGFAVTIIVILAALLLLFIIRRWSQHRQQSQSSNSLEVVVSDIPGAPDALKQSSAAWAQMADQLAKEGRFREAVRSLYLALLAQLHSQGLIDYNVHYPNTQYLQKFKGTSTALSVFRDLTLRFDFAWYGHLGATSEGFQHFKLHTLQLIRAPHENEANRA